MRPEVSVLILVDDQLGPASLEITCSWLASLSRPAARPTLPVVSCVAVSQARKDPALLDACDQLWLIGYDGTPPDPTDGLTRAINARMNAGCGVLATGDHDDRGWRLCGEVERVGQLRQWRLPGNAPANGPGCIDTVFPMSRDQQAEFLVRGSEEDVQFKPVFSRYTEGNTHPIMKLGENETIAWLPDHPHEGALELAADADLSDFDGIDPSHTQTIAWAMAWQEPIGGGQRQDPRAVPIVRVYDPPGGSKHGRIVVDSTFHHWLNVNLRRISELPPGPQREPFRHWQAYAANIYEFLLPERLR